MTRGKGTKLISIVLPAYKQEKTIVADLKQLKKSLALLPIESEIILVVDGLLDKTYEYAKKLRSKQVKVFGYPQNLGKGHAVRFGILKAKGDIIGFIDAGMDIDSKGIGKLVEIIAKENADIVIGSKLHPKSVVRYPSARKLLSWGYRTLTRLLFGFAVRDTQVGLKLFRRKVAQDVFSRVLVKRFAFDVEILAVAYSLGYKKIYEAPIKITYNWNSSIVSKNFWKIIFWMLWDTAAVFYRLQILHYYKKKSL